MARKNMFDETPPVANPAPVAQTVAPVEPAAIRFETVTEPRPAPEKKEGGCFRGCGLILALLVSTLISGILCAFLIVGTAAITETFADGLFQSLGQAVFQALAGSATRLGFCVVLIGFTFGGLGTIVGIVMAAINGAQKKT